MEETTHDYSIVVENTTCIYQKRLHQIRFHVRCYENIILQQKFLTSEQRTNDIKQLMNQKNVVLEPIFVEDGFEFIQNVLIVPYKMCVR